MSIALSPIDPSPTTPLVGAQFPQKKSFDKLMFTVASFFRKCVVHHTNPNNDRVGLSEGKGFKEKRNGLQRLGPLREVLTIVEV